MHSHSDLLQKLGGSAKVAESLGANVNTVSNWRVRGVPWRYRFQVAELAKQKNVALPASFLSSDERAA